MPGAANAGRMRDSLDWLAEHGQRASPPRVALETLACSGDETPPPAGVIRDDVITRSATTPTSATGVGWTRPPTGRTSPTCRAG